MGLFSHHWDAPGPFFFILFYKNKTFTVYIFPSEMAELAAMFKKKKKKKKKEKKKEWIKPETVY